MLKNLSAIKNSLLSQQDLITRKIQEIELEDGQSGAGLETVELGVFAWQVHVRDTKEAVKNHLVDLSEKIRNSLSRLGNGTYGLCEHCGRQIEVARLKIMPTATLCIACK